MKYLTKIINKLDNLLTKYYKDFWSALWFVTKILIWLLVLLLLTPFCIKQFVNLFGADNVTISDFILFITAVFIIAYTYETQRTRKEMTRQTNLQQMPVLVLYVRNMRDKEKIGSPSNTDLHLKLKDYLIRLQDASYNDYLVLRNVGNGTAFNIKITSDNFEITKYKSKFLAPHKDEQPFAVCQKGNKKIESYNLFKDSIFKIYCEDITGAQHMFKYKIINIHDRDVQFIEGK